MMASDLPSSQQSTLSQTVHLVLDDFGPEFGRAYRGTAEEEADLESLIRRLISGEFSAPVRVIAFNVAEGWARDVSTDVAKEVLERIRLEGRELPDLIRNFLAQHTGGDIANLLRH